MSEEQFHSELSMDLLGLGSLNPWIAHNSSSRMAMYTGHVGSSLSVIGRTKRRSQTGMEREYAKYTFSKKVPVNASIIRSIERYPKRPGAGFIAENPQTVVIYEDTDTKQFGILELTKYHSIHQQFGFPYIYKQSALDKLYRGNTIRKGTIVADSPNVDESGNYMTGIETNVAFMSIPAVIEDGVVISDEYAERLTTKAYVTHVLKWGKNSYPLNLYGNPDDPNSYKPYPDIGEYVRADGLLFALRPHHELRSVVEMTREALREPDYLFDKLTYVEANAKVIDIRVYCDTSGKTATPVGMEEQSMKYARATSQFYDALKDEYSRLRKLRKDDLRITPEFQRLLVEAQSDIGYYQNNRITKTHRMVPLDDFRIELVLEYDLVPTIGFKITDCHGGKGVVCGIEKKENMPRDAAGNIADIIMDPVSTIKRMNLGRLYEHYVNAGSRDVSAQVRQMFGGDQWEMHSEQAKAAIQDEATVQKAFEYLCEYYRAVSPGMAESLLSPEYRNWFTSEQQRIANQNAMGLLYQEDPLSLEQFHVLSILVEGVYLWIPTNNTVSSVQMIKNIEKYFPPVHGPVSYRGNDGELCTTKENVLIASIYILLLDKTGSNWAGVSSAKLQHFGIPAKLTNSDKYAAPGRPQPVRYTGEAEGRSFSASMGGDAAADILDQSNNPAVHKHICYNLYTADKPTAIDIVVDRKRYPRGNGRPIVFVKHQLECGGWRLVRRKE